MASEQSLPTFEVLVDRILAIYPRQIILISTKEMAELMISARKEVKTNPKYSIKHCLCLIDIEMEGDGMSYYPYFEENMLHIVRADITRCRDLVFFRGLMYLSHSTRQVISQEAIAFARISTINQKKVLTLLSGHLAESLFEDFRSTLDFFWSLTEILNLTDPTIYQSIVLRFGWTRLRF
jgi:hypothetical protein